MPSTQTLSFSAQYENLAAISSFVSQAASAAGLEESAIYSIQMAVDEACSNIIEHAYGGENKGEIICSCQDTPDAFTIILSDHGKAFDPSAVNNPDTHANLEDRPVGGLGLFFIRQLMDDVRFEFKPSTGNSSHTNILTITKHKNAPAASTYKAIRRRADQLALVAEVSHAIISILDLDDLLDTVVNLLSKRLDYPYVQIYSVHPGRRKIFYESGNLPANDTLKQGGFSYNLDDPQGIIPWVARSGIAVLANDVACEPRYRLSEGMPAWSVRSELTTPLIFGQEVLGILDIQSDRSDAFGEDDRSLLEALAGNVAIALRNATLFRAEAWRRQVADGMREVAGLLSADADLDQVLDAILIELRRNLPCEGAAIWLLEETEDEPARLQLAAFYPLEVYPTSDENGEPSPGQWLNDALHSSEPLTRLPESPYEPLGQILGFPDDYSAVVAPLHIGSHRLGAMVLAHSTPNRYGSEARAITATFAGYAAVAIENTRLYEASHQQAWVATVLLQVAEAAQSSDKVQDLLVHVAEIATLLIGVDVCAFWLWDAHEDAFLPVAASGLSSDVQDDFVRQPVLVNEHTDFDQVRLTHKAVVLDDSCFDFLKVDVSSTCILFPLFAQSSDVIGVLLAGFTNVEDALREDNLAIIQGIAHQTATAIENIRLLCSQSEEAYVSVALLQVAQAIVSLNEVDEILDAITRIIPILVGIRRSAIFLYDEARDSFSLAKSYGYGSEEEYLQQLCLQQQRKFLLLKAVQEHKQLFYITISGSKFPSGDKSPAEWCDLPPLSVQPDDVEEPSSSKPIYDKKMLTSEETLLLAFPLAVKGQVLGVLLAEETQANPGEAVATVRAHRLEIMTGISQQVSLAIQNDLLQREVLERERLERELQLARQIQQTFLPEKLPHPDGWELSVCWRTARQVGGDFYDVFELPDNHLGLVIADVADKGIPAALFMTLVRTLIRAAVREGLSPAAVLKRVNELLLPDTRNGMFVTVVYAMLSVENGKLVYANAGHNPPLLVKQADGCVQRFLTGGMALGIVDDVQIPERSTDLQPGDFLVFYTDGVTESFSPKEEMYGEDRLHLVLQEVYEKGICHSKDVLKAIEHSVDSFTEDEFPSDDITMIALLRSQD